MIDGVIVTPQTDVAGLNDRLVISQPRGAKDISYRHDRQLLLAAIQSAVETLSRRPQS